MTRSTGVRLESDDMLKDALREFLAFLQYNRNLSPHTRRAYDTDLSQFLDSLAARHACKPSQLQVEQFDPEGAREFLAEMYRRGISRASAARRLAALRSFARYSGPRTEARRRSHRHHRRAAEGADAAGASARRGDQPSARDAGCRHAGRTPGPRDPGIVLRLRSAAERTGRSGPRGREPQRTHGSRAREGRKGTAGAVQPVDRRARYAR